MAEAEHIPSEERRTLATIHPIARFQRAIEDEFAFSTRGGLRFAVVAFSLERSRDAPLQSVLGLVLREVDTAGWMEDARLGILLRGVSLGEAKRRARDIARAIDPAQPPASTLYAFPPPGVDGQEA